MRLLGFSGRIGSGKTTAAEYVYDKLKGEREVWIKPIVEQLKEFTSMIFGIDYMEENHRSSDWANPEFKSKVHPCGKTYRELAQLLGTDLGRNIWPDIWLYHWEKGIDHVCPRCGLILVPDVRFPNELAEIQRRGGHVIRLLRAPHPEDTHETETALDEVEQATLDWEEGGSSVKRPNLFDACINNKAMTIEAMQAAVWSLVQGKGWV